MIRNTLCQVNLLPLHRDAVIQRLRYWYKRTSSSWGRWHTTGTTTGSTSSESGGSVVPDGGLDSRVQGDVGQAL